MIDNRFHERYIQLWLMVRNADRGPWLHVRIVLLLGRRGMFDNRRRTAGGAEPFAALIEVAARGFVVADSAGGLHTHRVADRLDHDIDGLGRGRTVSESGRRLDVVGTGVTRESHKPWQSARD